MTLIGMKNLLIIFSTLQIFQLPKIQPFNVSLEGNPSLKGDLSSAEKFVFYGLSDSAYLLTKYKSHSKRSRCLQINVTTIALRFCYFKEFCVTSANSAVQYNTFCSGFTALLLYFKCIYLQCRVVQLSRKKTRLENPSQAPNSSRYIIPKRIFNSRVSL